MNRLQSHKFFQEMLEAELERLRTLSGLGAGLNVVWAPNTRNDLSGEVKGNSVYVYEEDEHKALETLWHEFVDYCVSQAIEPYKQVTNKLIALINEEAYKRKEQVVEAITRLSKAITKRRLKTNDSFRSE